MSKELKIISDTYDLMLWLRKKVSLFPRHSKYSFGHRLESRVLDCLELFLSAKFVSEKSDLLKDASIKLEQVRFLFRLAKDTQLISVKSHEHASKCIGEIGGQLLAWRNYTSRK